MAGRGLTPLDGLLELRLPPGLVPQPLLNPVDLRDDPDELDLAVLVAAAELIPVDGPEHGPAQWAPWP